jgi:hypothetical protein
MNPSHWPHPVRSQQQQTDGSVREWTLPSLRSSQTNNENIIVSRFTKILFTQIENENKKINRPEPDTSTSDILKGKQLFTSREIS